MADTAAGIMLDTLHDWGVGVIFGLPGDGINGIMEGLRKREERIRFIQVRHEEAAAFMACGYARYRRSLGACLATSGPGGIHLVSGLYKAKSEHLPVVALTGHHYHDVIGTHTQQDVDLTKLFSDVAVYSERVMGPAHAENVTHVACRSALGCRGVAHINIPTDIQDQTAMHRSKENVAHHQSATPGRPVSRPTEQALHRAKEVLNAGRSVVILCGRDIEAQGDELGQLADALAAPILSEEFGRSPVPRDNPHNIGCLGMLGAQAARLALSQCDTLFLIGAAVPHDDAKLAQGIRIVDLDPGLHRACSRDAIEVSLAGEIGSTLQALTPLVHRKTERTFLHQIQAAPKELSLSHENGQIPLQVLSRELSPLLSQDGILVSDSGSLMDEADQSDDEFSEQGAADPSVLPYALAAQLALPNRQCVAVLKEASYAMLMAEFATAVKYRLPVRLVVVKASRARRAPVDYASFAKACGGAGFTVQSAADCGDILKQAFHESGPVLVAA